MDKQEKIEYIHNTYERGFTYSDIARHLNVSRQYVHQLAKEYTMSFPRDITDIHAVLRKRNCEICNAPAPSEVHHIDGDRNNNKIYNLMSACTRCHHYLHRKQLPYRHNYKIKVLPVIPKLL